MKQDFINGTAYHGDCLEVLKTLPGECVDSVITSPPYWQLRDYNFDGQWGMEADFNVYLEKMLSLMNELKRILKPMGTMWINLGDTYSKSVNQNNNGRGHSTLDSQNGKIKIHTRNPTKCIKSLPDKSLMLIPHRFAIRCIDELGLILRNDIIWAKPNGMPESVTDRFSKKHEFVFFFVKNKKYYFDLDSVRDKPYTSLDRKDTVNILRKTVRSGLKSDSGFMKNNPLGKNPGDVSDFWDLPTKSSSAEHFATYNTDLIRKPVLAGSPVGGIILDPFAGTGTTAVAAIQYDRKFLMIEGNKEYYNLMCNNIRNHDLQLKLNFEEVI